ncbi:VC0807 family protein [Streptomyces sp. TG1A-8]|uniref:VC0807 family protein n=1 Tax=Streptomyces sp. TG1A-8 TaxID=3051385 RepID=UPI00265BBFFE|nr:VC0807 family protein [Streptomyces sp. TG1A-8]MDO0924404.1 VC0807 family protein [Streptomyces sp. TG1A-8]
MKPPTSRPDSPASPAAHGEDDHSASDSAPSSRWGFVVTVVCDIALPVGLYYLLRAAGASEIVALLLSGSAPALHALYSAVRHRRVDAVGVFTLALLLLSAGASLLTSDPRIALARNGLFTALAGVWLLVTLFMARPFTYLALRTLVQGRADLLERLWTSDAAFRRVWRALTVLWGVGLLCDAAVRLVMAYTLPVDTVPALDAGLYAVSWVVLQIITQVVLFRTGTLKKVFGDLRPGHRSSRGTPDASPDTRP